MMSAAPQLASALELLNEAEPLEPSRELAQQWATEELANGRYAAAEPEWYQQLVTWIMDTLRALLDSLVGEGNAVNAPLATLALGVVAVLATIVIVRFGGTRRSARANRAGDVFTETEQLSAQAHRGRAEQAEATGDHDTAVIEWFRATARGLEERTVLAPRPGRTAHEVAIEAGPAVGESSALALARFADLFDDVRYGDAHATARESTIARDTEALVRNTAAVLQ